ncbi:ankyrin repeat domain-containing protein [Myxococcus sp. CA056]|uniref:ankyrin repeat domain-containing protein n=1 Tax=Myxococcus sp. CA056 TaxID=2741740 RepID=UPI00157B9E76|nr:ankyrin repeat domain-containing protein [Myxococcus sp. CA056]NTX11353.1 ankyrin repeat domain-containing protein [Myxococcus sp. CA056]
MSANTAEHATKALLSLCADKHRWARELNVDTVRDLLSQGAEVNARNESGVTPLHLAVRGPSSKTEPLPDVEVVRALITAGADVNARDALQQTPLRLALPTEDSQDNEARALEIIRVLRAAGGQVPSDVRDWRSSAFSSTSAVLLSELLDAGAPLDARDEEQLTPLHRAAARGVSSVIELLLARGAELNALDGLGRTPLGVTLRERDKKWVQANQRTKDFDATASALMRAGGTPSLRYERRDDPFAPLPVDGPAVRAALSKVAPFPFKHDVDSAQELATGLHDRESGLGLELLETLVPVLDGPPRPLRLQGPLTLKRAFFHHGDLEVEGDLTVLRAFAVTGNVTVHGVLTDGSTSSLVRVLGNVSCHALDTGGRFSVGKCLQARDVVLGSGNDFVLSAGTLKARVVIEDDHVIDAVIKADYHFDKDTYARGYGEGIAEWLRELFVAEVLKEEDDTTLLDGARLFDRIRKGLPVFQDGAP